MNGYQVRKRIQTKACLRDLRPIDRKQGHRGIELKHVYMTDRKRKSL